MSSRSPLRGSSLYNSASGSAGYPSVQAVGGFKSTKPATPARKRSADPEGAPEAGAKRGKDERVIDAHIGACAELARADGGVHATLAQKFTADTHLRPQGLGASASAP